MNKYNRGGAVQAHRIRDDEEIKAGDFTIDQLKPRVPQRVNWWKPMQMVHPGLPWKEDEYKEPYWCHCGLIPGIHKTSDNCTPLLDSLFGERDYAAIQYPGVPGNGSQEHRGPAAHSD